MKSFLLSCEKELRLSVCSSCGYPRLPYLSFPARIREPGGNIFFSFCPGGHEPVGYILAVNCELKNIFPEYKEVKDSHLLEFTGNAPHNEEVSRKFNSLSI